jgi:hypothetical protein
MIDRGDYHVLLAGLLRLEHYSNPAAADRLQPIVDSARRVVHACLSEVVILANAGSANVNILSTAIRALTA